MPTRQQIEQFVVRAKQSGYSDEEIEKEILRKQRSEPTATAPTTRPAPTQQQPTGGLGFLNKATGFLAPRVSKLAKRTGATIGLAGGVKAAGRGAEQRKVQSESLIRQAKQEIDPKKRRRLLEQANQLAAGEVEKIQGAVKGYEEAAGEGLDIDRPGIFAEAAGVAGELGTFGIPVGKLAKGASLVQRILQGAKVGGAVGALHGVTAPEDISIAERGKQALTGAGFGAVTAGGVSLALGAPRSIVKKFLSGNKERVARLFKISPSKRAEFRRSTGNMNFEEEIMTRDGRAIAGKSYEEMLGHFSNRLKEATTALSSLLKASDKTISRNKMVNAIQRRVASLAPEKGNVATAGAIRQLQGAVEDLSKLPDDDITLPLANRLKRQLQDAGSAAFSPDGKATPTSKALAGASGIFKRAIEKAEKGARKHNQSIQLYRAARSSIEKVGDREATKVSNSIGQKFLQMLPWLGGGIAGVGGVAAGGGVAGGVGGAVLAATLMGGAGAARVKFLSPQMQSRLASNFQRVLKNQGIKNADAAGSRIVQEISKQLARGVTLREGAEETGGLAFEGDRQAFVSPEGEPTQAGEGVAQPIGQQPVGAIEQEGARREQEQVAHAPSVSGTHRIRNKRTGEVKTVQQGELGQYGLGRPTEGGPNGLPPKNQLVAAMVMDLQSGGKNIAKLNTILNAYKDIAPEGELDLTENQKKQMSNLSKSQDLVKKLAGEAKSILSEESAFKARYKGAGLKVLGKAGLIRSQETQSKVAAFSKIRTGLRVQIARGLGEVGNLSEPEQRAALALLPDITMSTGEIDENVRLMQETIDLAKKRVLEFAGGAPALFPLQGGAAAL